MKITVTSLSGEELQLVGNLKFDKLIDFGKFISQEM